MPGLLAAFQQLSTDNKQLATDEASVTADQAQLAKDQGSVTTDQTTISTDAAAFVAALNAAPYNGIALIVDSTTTPPTYTVAQASTTATNGFTLTPVQVAQ